MNIGWVDYYAITDEEYAALQREQRHASNE
jgi:hypothetical protein